MTNSKGWLVGILGVLVAAGLWASFDFRQGAVTAAPLAQATATSTSTPTRTATPTSTPTRNPNDALEQVQGSRPIEYRAVALGDGSDARSVYIQGGSVVASGFPTPPPQYTAVPQFTAAPQFTQQPYATAEPSRTPYSVGSGAVQPVQPNGAPAAQTPVAVAMAGQQVQAATTVVIPAQTPVAYAIGDVITASTPVALTFANVCRVTGGSGFILGGQVATDQSTNTASYRLWLHQSAPPTLIADNAANTRIFANNAIRVGYLDFPAMATGTGSNTGATTFVFDSRVPYQCPAGSTSIVGVLEATAAFTPASAQQYWVDIVVAPN